MRIDLNQYRWWRSAGILLAVVLSLLTFGCGHRQAWEGLTPAQIAEAVAHKNIGIAHLEEGQRDKAAQEFQALTRVAPNVALGYANLAATMMLAADKGTQALELARKAVSLAPRDAAVRLLMSALLIQQRDYDGALEALNAAAAEDPNNPRVLFQLTEVHQLKASGNRLAPERKEPLDKLAAAHPDNLTAQLLWANYAAGTGDAAEARAALDRAVALVGSLPRGAEEYLKAAREALQAGDGQRAVGPVQTLTNLLSPTPRQQADRNTLEGARGDPATYAVREFNPAPPAPPAISTAAIPVRFVDVTTAMGLPAVAGDIRVKDLAYRQSALTVAPLTESAAPAIYVASPAVPGRLYVARNGRLVDATATAGLPQVSAEAATFVDVDNDSKLDLHLSGQGPDRVFRGLGGGRFASMSVRGLTPAGDLPSVLWADLDHDGDLDLLRTGPDRAGHGALRLFQNNADGSFTDVTRSAGLAAPVASPSAAVYADFDEDGDLDLFLANFKAGIASMGDGKAGSRIYDNQRGGRFMVRGLGQTPRVVAAATADVTRDTLPDLAVVGPEAPGILLYVSAWKPAAEAQPFNSAGAALSLGPQGDVPSLPPGFKPTDVDFFDYDNDGRPDLVVSGQPGGSGGGLVLLRNELTSEGMVRFTDASSILPTVPAASGVAPADLNGDGALDLVVLHPNGQLTLLRNDGGAKNHWLRVVLEGEIKGDSKNNAFGLGATIEAKRGRDYQKQTVTGPVTHFGLGGGDAPVDVVRVVWSNGVPQNWTEAPVAASGQRAALSVDMRMHGKQVLKGSCPFVYAWNGERYVFVTDCLWRSPLGLRLGPSFTAPHDQSADWVKIPREVLQPVNGDYFLSVTEELWETLYLDYARLVTVDHPAGSEVWVDEVFRFGPPATFRIHPVAEARLPVHAFDDAGRDQLPALRARDGQRVAGFEVTRYQGVARPHDLTLDLGRVPDPSRVVLYLQGWIFPTDTSINMAVSQNRAARVLPPRLDVPDGRGGWRTVAAVGLPGGKNKTVIVDLSDKLNPSDARVRITTTMEIYWDHVFYTSGPQRVPMQTRKLRPVWSDLHYRGFSALLPRDRTQPHLYDHDRVDRGPRWRDIEGAYTRYGDVTPLLEAIDDRYVVMNAGDEVVIQFDGRGLPALRRGWVRDFILLTDGWDKDADINTLASQRVEPLPFHGMKAYPPTRGERYPNTPAHRRYRQEYNTRHVTWQPFLNAVREYKKSGAPRRPRDAP